MDYSKTYAGFSRRVMQGIHSRNNPDKLRPGHAQRENTRSALTAARQAHTEQVSWDDNTAEVGSRTVNKPGGQARAEGVLTKRLEDTREVRDSLIDARKNLSGLDPDRPSRGAIRSAKKDVEELQRFSESGSSRTYGVSVDDADYPMNSRFSGPGEMSRTVADTRDNTPGPVMKPVLKGARAAGKAIGKAKAKRAAKNTPAASDDPFDDPY